MYKIAVVNKTWELVKTSTSLKQPIKSPFAFCALEANNNFLRVLRGTHGSSWVAPLGDWGSASLVFVLTTRMC